MNICDHYDQVFKYNRSSVAYRTVGNQRRYDASKLPNYQVAKFTTLKRKTIGYARVSSHDQKPDLIRQQEMLSLFCTAHGWEHEIISDLGSGMNYGKRGLRKLLQSIIQRDINRIVLTHNDWFSLLYDEPNKGFKIVGKNLQLSLGMGNARGARSLLIPLQDSMF